MRKLVDTIAGLLVPLGVFVFVSWLLSAAPQQSIAATRSAAAVPNIAVGPPGDVVRSQRQVITRAEWGERWPFTTDVAVLVCVPEIKSAGAYVVVDGEPFAATGVASTFARQHRIDVIIDGVRKRPGLFNVDNPQAARVWAMRESLPGEDPLRRSFGPVISALAALGCGGR